MIGRPPVYTRELADKIIEEVANGGSIMEMVKRKGYPCWGTLWGWEASNHDGFGERMRAAKMSRAHRWAEETIAIADKDELDANDKRVRIDTRLRVAAMADARLAAKSAVDHTGEVKLTIRKMAEHD